MGAAASENSAIAAMKGAMPAVPVKPRKIMGPAAKPAARLVA